MAAHALVVGGNGFIGRHLLRQLLADGRFARIDSVDLTPPAEPLDGIVHHALDARRPLPETLAGPETMIFNLAALRTFPGHPDADYFDTNVGTTRSVIALAEAGGARIIVFTSTMSVYATGDEPKTETSPIAPCNAYGASKVEAENLHRQWLARHPEARLIICRPAVIFGYGDNGNFTRLATALRRGYFAYAGRRDTIKSAGYVGDLNRSMLFALDRNEREIVYNFAYPHRYTLEEIVSDFCAVGGFRKPRLTLPLGLLNAAAIPFEMLDRLGLRNPVHRKRIVKLTESTNIVPRWLEEEGFRFQTDLRSALAAWLAESPEGTFK
jgi:nucleoside-diphosphate-sugar epimerase